MASGKRLDGETFDDYRKRLVNEEAATKLQIRGKVVWTGAFQGAYKKNRRLS